MIHNLTWTKSSRLDLASIHGWGRGDGLSQLGDDFLSEPVVIGFDGEASGVGVSAAAEAFGDAGDVDAVFGAEADAVGGMGHFAEEGYGFDVADGQRVVDDAVGIVFGGAGLFERLFGHGDPGDASRFVALQGRKHRAGQQDLGVRVVVEDRLREFGRLRAVADQFAGDFEGAFGGVGEMERSGVGQQRGVNATGDFGRDLRADGFGAVVDHLAHGGGDRVNPVEIAEEFGRRMMINVDHELIFEAGQSGARHVAAFDDEDRVVLAVDVRNHADFIGAGQPAISMRHVIAHYHFSLFFQPAQNPTKRQRGPEAVSVGSDMRSDGEALMFFNQFDNLA